MLWNTLVPVLIYIIAAINSLTLTSLFFFLFIEVYQTQTQLVIGLRKKK